MKNYNWTTDDGALEFAMGSELSVRDTEGDQTIILAIDSGNIDEMIKILIEAKSKMVERENENEEEEEEDVEEEEDEDEDEEEEIEEEEG